MAKYVAGYGSDSSTQWHVVDESGPDEDAVPEGLPNRLSFNKTKCGRHIGSKAYDKTTKAYPACTDCK